MPWQVYGGQRTACSRRRLLPAMVVVVVVVEVVEVVVVLWGFQVIGLAACAFTP